MAAALFSYKPTLGPEAHGSPKSLSISGRKTFRTGTWLESASDLLEKKEYQGSGRESERRKFLSKGVGTGDGLRVTLSCPLACNMQSCANNSNPAPARPRLGINVLQLERYKDAFDRYDEATVAKTQGWSRENPY